MLPTRPDESVLRKVVRSLGTMFCIFAGSIGGLSLFTIWCIVHGAGTDSPTMRLVDASLAVQSLAIIVVLMLGVIFMLIHLLRNAEQD